MESNFDRMRANVSAQLTIISELTLGHILNGISEAESMLIKSTESILSGATEANLICNQKINQQLVNVIQQIGFDISQCAYETDHAIQAMVERFYDSLQVPQATSIDILNLVLSHFNDWNPIDHLNDLSNALNESLQQARNVFTTETLPALRDELNLVSSSTSYIPKRTESCINDILLALTKIVNSSQTEANNCSN